MDAEPYIHTATVVWSESAYRLGERTQSVTLRGTDEQIADHVRQTVLNALSFGSHVTEIKVIPVQPHSIFDLTKR